MSAVNEVQSEVQSEVRSEVEYVVDGGVATVTLSRPERLNAWTPTMEQQYFDALLTADAAPDVRAVVVTGAGRGFCPGADMQVLGEVVAGTLEVPPGERHPMDLPARLGIPLVAAINGAAAGVGLVQALLCDVRFAAAGAKLATSFVRRGLVAEYGLSWLLPRLIGTSRALDLLLSGRTVTAEEALGLGLVNHVLPADEVLPAAQAYARDLATWSSPTSMAIMKAQVYGDATRTLAEATERAGRLMVESFGRPDMGEGVAAWIEKREPRFPPCDAAAVAVARDL